MDEKSHLGDAVYASYDGWMIKLETRDGGEIPTNTIYLEPAVLNALINYAKKIGLLK